jgi:Homeobox KN domain
VIDIMVSADEVGGMEVKVGQRARSISTESSTLEVVHTSMATKPQAKVADCKKKPTTLPNETVEYLKAWMMSPEHIAHPYPTELEKAKIMEETGLELKQLTNWFVNNRKRYWKPRVEARLKDQLQNGIAIDKPDGPLSPASNNETKSISTDASSGDETKRTSKRRSTMTRRSSQSPNLEVKTTMHSEPPIQFVIDDNSVACISDGVTSSDDDDESEGRMTSPEWTRDFCVEETVDVHILRPTDGRTLPELADVTVLHGIPNERILRTFESCAVTFRYNDAKKAQSRRDAEIVRMKKHYLATYLLETSQAEEAAILIACGGTASLEETPSKKRKEEVVHIVPLTPRPKYRRRSVELWKEACQTAHHVYDQDLPSLEEATLLFGYSA